MRGLSVGLGLLAATIPAAAGAGPSPADLARFVTLVQPERPNPVADLRGIAQPVGNVLPTPIPTPGTVLILNGTDVLPGEAPWQAQIMWAALQNDPDGDDAWQRKHQCGGVVIAQHWVLTAAHCFNIRDADFDPAVDMRVRVGLVDIRTSDAPLLTIARVVRHPDYQAPTPGSASRPKRHDIALVELVEPIFADDEADTVPMPLAGDPGERDVEGGDSGTVTGWGQTGSALDDRPTERLQRGALLLLSRHDCNVEHGAAIIDRGMICGFEHSFFGEITSICRGDSGGPLITHIDGRRQLAGIASWIEECGTTPSVFTSVRAHRAWIEQVMAQP